MIITEKNDGIAKVLPIEDENQTDNTAAPLSAGRPRDPGIEDRASAAALDIYGRLGWSGFTIGKVAQQAGVGKSSLYLRWQSKEELLVFALSRVDALYLRGQGQLPDTIPFLEKVIRVSRHRSATYFSAVGLAILRIMVENQAQPEVISELWERSLAKGIMRTREMLRTAIKQGDLLEHTDIVLLGDSLEGAMVMHALATPSYLRTEVAVNTGEYVESLVKKTFAPYLTEKAKSEYAAYSL